MRVTDKYNFLATNSDRNNLFKRKSKLFCIFVIKVDGRDALREHLTKSGIECGLHYKPNHLLTKYRVKSKLPVTESCYAMTITLPCHVDLSVSEQDYVIQTIKEFYGA